MTDTPDRTRGRTGFLLGFGWWVCLAVWTAALLTTTPAAIGKEALPTHLHFPTAKALHVCAYAFLTTYAARLPVGRMRWLLLALLSLHAAGTEFLQLFVPGRTGKVTDVLIDHVGIVLGLSLSWKRWLSRSDCRLPLRTAKIPD
jgi:VanZ family protein